MDDSDLFRFLENPDLAGSGLLESAEDFHLQLRTLANLTKELEAIPEKIKTLEKNAAQDDPKAQAQMQALGKACENGLLKQLNDMHQDAQKMIDLMSDCSQLFEKINPNIALEEAEKPESATQEITSQQRPVKRNRQFV